MKRKILIVVLAVISALCFAIGFSGCFKLPGTITNEDHYFEGTKGLEYKYNSASKSYSCTGKGYTTETNITIVSHVDGKPVTSIGWGVFFNCTSLESVTFENTTGWKISENSNMSKAKSIDVTNATQNATYFKSTYHYYYWKR